LPLANQGQEFKFYLFAGGVTVCCGKTLEGCEVTRQNITETDNGRLIIYHPTGDQPEDYPNPVDGEILWTGK